MRKWVAGLLLSISVILLTISLYFLMGFFMQERQDNQLQQELQELMQKREDESEEDASGDSLIEIDAGNVHPDGRSHEKRISRHRFVWAGHK